eukprot:m.339673 g.339673  ORF g.339673 m.339673 type:complete len:253 (+) comp18908_c0_seq1:132-890(+)
MNTASVRAIVTGGGSGLGLATAEVLASKGAKVLVADLQTTDDNAARIQNFGAMFASTDVTSEEQVGSALDALETFAGGPVNTVVNCAGICPGKLTYSKSGPHGLELFSKVLNVNVSGTFNVIRLAAERMAGTEAVDGMRGVIVNTASIAAYEGQRGQAAYSASKGAIVGMTLPIARDLSRFGIRVCSIAPGTFKTPLIDGLTKEMIDKLEASVPCPSRMGDPKEFGSLVEHIINNAYINGEVIRIDGALRMV